LPLIFAGCGKQLWAVVAIRKRCSSAFWRDPTANTACGCVLRTQHSFPAAIRVYSRSFAVKKPDPNPRSSA
jgi:hypothetical protein